MRVQLGGRRYGVAPITCWQLSGSKVMSKREDKVLIDEWLARPVCGKYSVGILRSAVVDGSESEPTADRCAYWLLGCMPEGEAEILGLWMSAERTTSVPHQMFADLYARGVENIFLLVDCVSGTAGARPAGTMPHDLGGIRCGRVLALEASSLGSSPALLTLRPAVRRAALLGAERVEAIQRLVSHAIAGHAAFADEAQALAFVAKQLMRADRRLRQPVSRGRAGRVAPLVSGTSAALC